MKRSSTQKGFTLLELVIYLTLVVGILVTATTFAWNIINSRTKAFAIQEVQQNGRFIMDKFTQTVRSAQDITVPVTGASGDTLELVMRDVSKDPIIFSLSGGILSMSAGGGTTYDLHSSAITVSALQFTNVSSVDDASRNVQVQVTLEHKNPENRSEREFSETFRTTIELRDR